MMHIMSFLHHALVHLSKIIPPSNTSIDQKFVMIFMIKSVTFPSQTKTNLAQNTHYPT
jgi:hypothetical protein